MQGYQIPRATATIDPAYADEAQNMRAGYQPTWGLPDAPAPVRSCGNPLCVWETEALYCSDYCRETVEGEEPEQVTDDTITLPQLDAAIAYIQEHATPAQCAYIALRLGDPQTVPLP